MIQRHVKLPLHKTFHLLHLLSYQRVPLSTTSYHLFPKILQTREYTGNQNIQTQINFFDISGSFSDCHYKLVNKSQRDFLGKQTFTSLRASSSHSIINSSNKTNETMSETAANKKTCEPCASLSPTSLLTNTQINEKITSFPTWSTQPIPNPDSYKKMDDTSESTNNKLCLSRKFVARNFLCAQKAFIDFGKIAERENHHFDFHLTNYRNVELIVYTHSVGGITENDFVLAEMLDKEVVVEYSPKWLKSHPEAAFVN